MTTPHAAKKIIANLQKGIYAPLYFFQGTEPYYIDQMVRYMERHILSEVEKSFNLTTVYGREQTMQAIIMLARSFPMVGKRQLIIVKEAQQLQDLQKASTRKLLLHYLAHPNPHTLLVFVHKEKTLDSTKPLSKALAKSAVVVTTKQPYENQIPNWIHNHLADQGYNISSQAAVSLQMMVGNNLTILANELQKIIINLPKGSTIDQEVVSAHVGISKEFNMLELQSALSSRHAEKACRIVQYLSKNPKKYPLLVVITLLTTFFTKLLCLHHNKEKHPAAIASVLQVHPYFIKDYLKGLQHYTLPQVLQSIHHLHQADLQAKGIHHPTLPDAAILKELIAKILAVRPNMRKPFR